MEKPLEEQAGAHRPSEEPTAGNTKQPSHPRRPGTITRLFFRMMALAVLITAIITGIEAGSFWSAIIALLAFAIIAILFALPLLLKSNREKKNGQPPSGPRPAGPTSPGGSASDTGTKWRLSTRWVQAIGLILAAVVTLIVLHHYYPEASWWLIAAVILGIWLWREEWFRKTIVYGAIIVAALAILLAVIVRPRIQALASAYPPGYSVVPSPGSPGSFPNYNPDPLAISLNAHEVGENDHLNDNGIDYFDLVLAGDGQFGKEGYVRPPSSWVKWKKYWVSNEPGRHVGFLYAGDWQPIGPFGANNLPLPDDSRFNNRPREWLVQGVGTLRYERIR